MEDYRRPLKLPPAVETVDNAIEMLRVWIAEGGIHCVLNAGHWHNGTDIDERHAWGIMLADIANHISNAMEDVAGFDNRESLRMVAESFSTEIANRTTEHRGEWPADS